MRIAAEIDSLLVVSTKEVGRRLGLTLTATFLTSLGLTPYAVCANGTYWLQSELPAIRDALVAHLMERPLT